MFSKCVMQRGLVLQTLSVSSVVQFYNCVNRLGTARIQLQEAPGGQIPLLEAGSHLKPYGSVVQFYNCVNRLGTMCHRSEVRLVRQYKGIRKDSSVGGAFGVSKSKSNSRRPGAFFT